MNTLVAINVTKGTAFGAGFLSFFTPCILPIIPGFIAYFIVPEERKLSSSLLNAFAFVLGLSFVFINLGLLSGYLGGFISSYKFYFNLIGGIIIVILGFYIMKIIDIPFIGKMSLSTRNPQKKNFVSTFILGLVFSLVWSPCLSPTLGTILLISSQTGKSIDGGILLAFYSIGFAIPFILSAVFLERFVAKLSKIQNYQPAIEKITGIILISIGISMAFGIFDKIFV